jgi:hypothetical protein
MTWHRSTAARQITRIVTSLVEHRLEPADPLEIPARAQESRVDARQAERTTSVTSATCMLNDSAAALAKMKHR